MGEEGKVTKTREQKNSENKAKRGPTHGDWDHRTRTLKNNEARKD